MVFEDYTAELNARGLVVIRDCCIKARCNNCLSELQKGFDIMMQLPGVMNEENSKRQFLKFPVSKCAVVPQECSHRRYFTMCHSKNTIELLKTIIASCDQVICKDMQVITSHWKFRKIYLSAY